MKPRLPLSKPPQPTGPGVCGFSQVPFIHMDLGETTLLFFISGFETRRVYQPQPLG